MAQETKHVVQFGSFRMELPILALALMLAGILFPTVLYSVRLQDPTPAQLLVAVCMALFSSVLFLWILDATSVLPFRAAWISKSVYGAAIVSVLGTSVAVYKDAFAGRQYPYEGLWQITTTEVVAETRVAEHKIVLSFSGSAETYFGYSDIRAGARDSAKEYVWTEITDFVPAEGRLSVRLVRIDGTDKVLTFNIAQERHGRLFRSRKDQGDGTKYEMVLARLK